MSLCLGFFFVAETQTPSNPFDLQYRQREQKSTSRILPPKSGIDSSGAKSLELEPGQNIPIISGKENKADTSLTNPGPDSSSTYSNSNPFEKGGKLTTDSIIDSGQKSTTIAQDKPLAPSFGLQGRSMSKGVQIFFILLSLLFLIFIVNVERNFVRDLWRVISNENYSSLHLRNQRNTMRQILLMMGYAVFIFQAGTFLFHVLVIFGYQGKILHTIWACIAFVLVVYVLRHIMISYLRWLFNNEKEMTLFGFDISIFNIMVGLVLLPLNVLLNFGPESLTKPLIIIGLIVITIAYLTRQLRWLLTARRLIANSLFLFFVYLCAVEILPLWAISKFFW
jgi:hypothetical protein